MTKISGRVRVAAVGDLHFGRAGHGAPLRPLFAQVAERADVLALCGDLTDTGASPRRRGRWPGRWRTVTIPIVAVLGNHDYESGKVAEVEPHPLRRRACTCSTASRARSAGVGFAGVKGFAGGFGRRALGPWGEERHQAVRAGGAGRGAQAGDRAGRLRTERRVALLHYSPIEATVEGEPREIYPFLGCSRLEEPLTRYPVDAVFHGHAHHGTPEGRTHDGVPVYNVSLNLLQRTVSRRAAVPGDGAAGRHGAPPD